MSRTLPFANDRVSDDLTRLVQIRGDLKSWTPSAGQASIELDVFWHAMHYLVTGDANSTFLQLGVQIPEVFEHCEVHSPQDVAAPSLRTVMSSIMRHAGGMLPA